MNLRKYVIRLFLFTGFMLLVAWFGLKIMQYRGDTEAMLRDLQAFYQDNLAKKVEELKPFFEEKLKPFFEEKIVPMINGIVEPIRGFISDAVSGS